MNISITLDYEIFFGKNGGCAYNCLLHPTEILNDIAKKYGVTFTFFVDAGFLLKLKEWKNRNISLLNDYDKVRHQLSALKKNGHSIQLHIHPHWERTTFNGDSWEFDHSFYKLHSFDSNDIFEIVRKYKMELEEITGSDVFAFRAGGWSIDPFSGIKDALEKNNITVDSTVISNSFSDSYDFRNSPRKTSWFFSGEPNKEDKNGHFLEVPISSVKVQPLFYWKLIFSKTIKTKNSTTIGDGIPLNPSFKNIAKWLVAGNRSTVSLDGYKSNMLLNALNDYRSNFSKDDFFTIIGHPKSLTRFSIEKIQEFIDFTHQSNNYINFNFFAEKKIHEYV